MHNTTLCKKSLQASCLFQDLTKLKQKKQTILIVEDNADYRAMLKFLLQSFFYKIVVVITAEEALKFLAEHSEEVILILSDIDLPGISGLEFIKKVRANSSLNQIPIIVQSSENEEELQKGLTLGANNYVQKPYDKEVLYSEIIELIKLTTKKEKSCKSIRATQ